MSSWEQHVEFTRRAGSSGVKYGAISELYSLNLTGLVHFPDDWTGVVVHVSIYGERGLMRAMEEHSFSAGPRSSSAAWSFDGADFEHVGHLHPFLKTRKPKGLNLDARLPVDMLIHVIRSLETGTITKIGAHTSRIPTASQKSRWVQTLSFFRVD